MTMPDRMQDGFGRTQATRGRRVAHSLQDHGHGGSGGGSPSAALLGDTLAHCRESDGIAHAFALVSPAVDPETLTLSAAARVIAADYDARGFRAWIADRLGPDAGEAMLGVLGAVARQLGDMWLADDCTFNDVTIGMHRLTLLLIGLEPPTGDPHALPQHGGRIFVAPAPGDQHGFGLAMVGFHLRRAGWDVSAELEGDAGHILDRVATRDYDCIGFSVGHERAIAPVAALIREVRRVSRRRTVRIAVGGPMIVADRDLGQRMAADIWADDAAGLVERLRELVPAALAQSAARSV